MTNGSSQGLFVIVSVVIFGIFVGISYILFDNQMNTGLSTVFSESINKSFKSSNTTGGNENNNNKENLSELLSVTQIENRNLANIDKSNKEFTYTFIDRTLTIKKDLVVDYTDDLEIFEFSNSPQVVEFDFNFGQYAIMETKLGDYRKEADNNENIKREYEKNGEIIVDSLRQGKTSLTQKEELALLKYVTLEETFSYAQLITNLNKNVVFQDREVRDKYNSFYYSAMFFDKNYNLYINNKKVDLQKEEPKLSKDVKEIKYTSVIELVGLEDIPVEVIYNVSWI